MQRPCGLKELYVTSTFSGADIRWPFISDPVVKYWQKVRLSQLASSMLVHLCWVHVTQDRWACPGMADKRCYWGHHAQLNKGTLCNPAIATCLSTSRLTHVINSPSPDAKPHYNSHRYHPMIWFIAWISSCIIKHESLCLIHMHPCPPEVIDCGQGKDANFWDHYISALKYECLS